MKDASGWIAACFVGGLIYLGVSTAWNSKLKYAFEYGVSFSDVTEDKKPHDCDWLKAPIGDKECYYDADAQVTKVRTALDHTTGRPIISYEGGAWIWDMSPKANSYSNTLTESPSPGTPSPGPYVIGNKSFLHISWKRTEK